MLYQLATDNDTDMNYKPAECIPYASDCILLVVCARHIIPCQVKDAINLDFHAKGEPVKEKRIQCYDLRGVKEREWALDALSRYIKVIGGPPGRETLLVGLRNGQILKIFLHNPFPVEIFKLQGAIQGVDLSLRGLKLAVVDDNDRLTVYHMKTKEIIFRVTCLAKGNFLAIYVLG